MTHPTLFDVTNHDGNVGFTYRQSDPETSKQAAANVAPKLVGLRAKFVEGVRACGGKATAMEAAAKIGANHSEIESIRKRAKECVRAGAVRVCGTREVDGNKRSVYEVVK